MKINDSTTFAHVSRLLEEVRSEATGMERLRVHQRNLLPGDILVETGETIRQVFTHAYVDGSASRLSQDEVFVWLDLVRGLRVITGATWVFRPVMPS